MRIFLALLMTMCAAAAAQAQSIGTFRWQLQPFCNIVSMHVTYVAGVYRLDGADDQCGVATVAPVSGVAVLNPDGSIALGLTHVTTPGGAPVHVDAVVTLPGAGGTWRDSAGNSGSFVLTPGAGIGGAPRPSGGIGAAAIDASEVQLRIGGACAAGAAVRAVNQNGSVTCEAIGGDISAVVAGQGLVGGAASGDAALAVDFGGPGAAATVARSDHTHQRGGDATNVAVGAEAMAFAPSGSQNTAIGYAALRASAGFFNTAMGTGAAQSTTGTANTVVGAQALYANTSSNNNAAFGDSALRAIDTDDHDNAAFGHHALGSLAQGVENVAVGATAGQDLATGSFNTMVGFWAGGNLTSGDSNIFIGRAVGAAMSTGSRNIQIGSASVASESDTIRIGVNQTSTYIAGIAGQTAASGVAVYVTGQGRLGTLTSSRRYKDHIRVLDDARRIVQGLQPVRFLYKPEIDATGQEQYGLIAEDVAAVDRNLVVEADGQLETVRYQFLPPLLVAEVQRLERERASLESLLQGQAAQLDELRRELAAVRAALATPR